MLAPPCFGPFKDAIAAAKADGTTPYATGHWFAFNLRGPGAGTYNATLNYQTRAEGNRDVKVYLIPGALTDAAEIQTALDSATSLTNGFAGNKDATGATGNYLAGVKDLGEVTLVDGDYTMVVYCASATGTYFFLNGLDLAEKAEEEELKHQQEKTVKLVAKLLKD